MGAITSDPDVSFQLNHRNHAITMIKVFFSYAREDEFWREELRKHLAVLERSGLVQTWFDRQIPAGCDFNREISENLESADVILLLLSPDFMASDYCYDLEGKRALERRDEGTAIVIPLIIQPCDWKESPFGAIQATPRDGKAVALFENSNEAFVQVVDEIRSAAKRLGKSDQSSLGASILHTARGTQVDSGAVLTNDASTVARNQISHATSEESIEILSVIQGDGLGQINPANVLGVSGKLDVIVRVDGGDRRPDSIAVTLTVGSKSITQQKALPNEAPSAASKRPPLLVNFGFHTAAFNATTGVTALSNGLMTIAASAISKDGSRASRPLTYRLLNADGLVVMMSFGAFRGPDGVPIPISTTDRRGYPWRHGSVTISALPIMYSDRKISSVAITLPGANIPTQIVTAPPYSATWSGTNGSVDTPSVAGRVLASQTLVEPDGITPKGIFPIIGARDAAGDDLRLAVLNLDFLGPGVRIANVYG